MSVELKCRLKIRLAVDVDQNDFINDIKSLGVDFINVSTDWFVDTDGDIKEFQNVVIVVTYDKLKQITDRLVIPGCVLMELNTTNVVNEGINVCEKENVSLVEENVDVPTKKEVKKTSITKKKKPVKTSSGVKWSERETATLMLLSDEGLTVHDIADKLNRDYNSVYKKLKRLNKTINKEKKEPSTESVEGKSAWTEEELDLLSVNLDKNIDELVVMLKRPARQIERKIDRLLDGHER